MYETPALTEAVSISPKVIFPTFFIVPSYLLKTFIK